MFVFVFGKLDAVFWAPGPLPQHVGAVCSPRQLIPTPQSSVFSGLMGSCLGIAPLLEGISKVTSPSVLLGAAPSFLSSSDRLGEECWLTSAASMALGQGRCQAGQLLAHRQPLKRS